MPELAQPHNNSFFLRFAPEPLPGQPLVLTKEVRKNLLQKLKCIQSIIGAYGTLVSPPYVQGGMLVLDILRVSDDLAQISPEQILEDLRRTHDEIQRNALSPDPKPHTVAVTSYNLLPILHALKNGCTDANSPAVLSIDGSNHLLPIPTAADFTEPSPEDLHQKTGEFRIVGLRRDDANGHRLLITRDDLIVHCPLNDPKWAWASIRDVLNCDAWLRGTIQRPGRGSPWRVCAETAIILQPSLPGVA